MKSTRLLSVLSITSLLLFGVLLLGMPRTQAAEIQPDNPIMLDMPKFLDSSQLEPLAPTAAITGSKLIATHSFGGSMWEVSGQGNRLYYNVGAELVIADITDPLNPVKVGSWLDSNKWAYDDVVVSGNLAFLPHMSAGVDIIDTTNAAHPTKVGRIPLLNLGPTPAIYDLAIEDNYAYIPQGKWFRVVDISDPTLPQDTSVITPTTDYLHAIAVSGDFAYVTAGTKGLVVIDVSSPASPKVRSILDTPGSPDGIAVQNNFVYLSDFGIIRIVDVSNPDNPVQVGTYEMTGLQVWENIEVVGNLLYLHNYYDGKLIIVDVSNPAAPSLLGTLSRETTEGGGLYVVGTTVYIGSYKGGLVIVGAANPRVPTIATTLSGMFTTTGIDQISDSNSVVIADDALWYLQVQGNAVSGASVWSSSRSLYRVVVQGNLAYLTAVDSAGYGHLEILDITDPSKPVSLGDSLLSIRGASSVVVSGTYAYVSSWNGISAIDISNPNNPSEITSLPSPSGINFKSLHVQGPYLYVATSTGLSIYSVSTPSAISLVGGYQGGDASDVLAHSNYAYLAMASEQKIRIVDVHTPSAPSFVRSLDTCGSVNAGLTLADNFLYVLNSCRLLAAYDIGSPQAGSSRNIASAGLPWFGEDLVAHDDEVYVAGGSGGFVRYMRYDTLWNSFPAAGGTLISPNRDVQIDIPTDTFTDTFYIGYEEEPNIYTRFPSNVGTAFSVRTIYTGTFAQAPLPSGKHITVTVTYPQSSGQDDSLQLYMLESGSSVWMPVTSTVNTVTRQVVARLEQFSGDAKFALFGESNDLYLPSIVR